MLRDVMNRFLLPGTALLALLVAATSPLIGQAETTLQDLQALEQQLRDIVAETPNTEARRELGVLLAQTGRSEEGLRHLEAWIEANPNDADARLAAALAATQLGQIERAETILAPLPSDLTSAQLMRGKVRLIAGDPERAIELLEPLLGEGDPLLEADVRRTISNAYLMVGNPDAALPLLEGATEPSIQALLGQAQYQAGDPEGAIESLAPLVGQLPESVDLSVRRALADSYILTGDPAQALPILEGRANDAGVAMLLAEARYQTGDVQGAIDELQPWAEQARNSPPSGSPQAASRAATVLKLQGRYLTVSGEPDSAIPLLQLATELEPSDDEAWQMLAQALGTAGRTEEAEEILARVSAGATTTPPADVDAVIEQAFNQLSAGENEAAVELLEGLGDPRRLPTQGKALLGTLYVDAGRNEEAWAILSPILSESDDPAMLYQAGRAAFGSGRSSEGVALMERSLAIQANTPASRDLGLYYGQVGRIADAYKLLRPWALSHPYDGEARVAAARAAIQLQRASAAEELLAGLPPEEPRVQLLQGKLRLLRGEPFGAVTILEPMVTGAGGPLETDARHTLAQAYLEIGEANKAIEMLEGLAVDDPALALKLGEALYQAGEVDRAIATVEPFAARMLARPDLAPGTPDGRRSGIMLREMGRFLVAAGRHEEAVPYLDRSTTLRPKDPQGWQSFGQALAASGETGRAMEAVKTFQALSDERGKTTDVRDQARALQENPAEWAIQEASRLASEGSFDEALDLIRSEAEMTPEDLRLRLFEAQLLLFAGRSSEALQVAEVLVALFPENPDTYYQRGVTLMSRQELEGAERDLRRAIELAPGHVPAMNDLAVMLLVRGDQDEARALLDRVLAIRPDDPQANEAMSRLEGRGP